MNHTEKLRCGSIYHIFNHAVGEENLFRERDNYYFFLRKYSEFLYPVCHTFAWCLLPNHFHFLLRIRSEDEVMTHFKSLKKNNPGSKKDPPEHSAIVMQCFSNFFNSYAKAYNKKYNRRGALFVDYVKRKEIKSESYFSSLIFYIHNNPVHHGFCKNMFDWEFSSIHSLLSSKKTQLEREEVINWFGSPEAFASFHRNSKINFLACELEELEF